MAGQEGGEEDDESESPKLDSDRNLTTAQLADSALDNVVNCPDCSRPVLQASLSDHQGSSLSRYNSLPSPLELTLENVVLFAAICPNSKNPGNLKRKLSEGS